MEENAAKKKLKSAIERTQDSELRQKYSMLSVQQFNQLLSEEAHKAIAITNINMGKNYNNKNKSNNDYTMA